MKSNSEKRVKLAIVDANVCTLMQPNQPLHYLHGIVDLEIVPARKAREEADVSGENFATPLSPDRDAPAPMMSNTLSRRSNDPAVLVGPTRGMIEAKKIAKIVYAKSTTDKHRSDQEIIGSVIELYYSTRPKYECVYFVSADQHCCKKARKYFAQENISIQILHARVPPAEAIPGIKTVQEIFVP